MSFGVGDDRQTQTAKESADEASRWRLDVIHHPEVEFVGRASGIETPIELGRGAELLGSGVFLGRSLSRQHTRLTPTGPGVLVEDLGSRNGTLINAQRVGKRVAVDGDVIALGDVLLLLTRDEVRHSPESDVFVAHSGVASRLLESLGAAVERGPVLLHGESGVGKSALAARLHAFRGTAAPLCVEIASKAGAGTVVPPGCTWLIEDPEFAAPAFRAWLLQKLPTLLEENVFPVLCSTRSVDSLRAELEPQLFNRLARWTIRVPPLRERRADIMPLARFFARRYAGVARAFASELAYVLVRHHWPGNAHELEAVIERVVVESSPSGLLDCFASLEAQLVRGASSRELSSAVVPESSPTVRMRRDGMWFEPLDGSRVDLARRETLRRVLASFAETYERWPGRAMKVAELVALGWPGERVDPRAGANRAYVALATLRKLGLRDVLVRGDDGYLLEPGTVELIE